MSNDTSLANGYRLHGGMRVYTIQEKLGQGGFGITYRAKAPVTVGNIRVQGDFALKEFFMSGDCERRDDSSVSYSNPARSRVENSRKDFLKEARRLNKLGFRHPNIVGVDEVFEANNTAYYVMEYLQGESLADYIRSHGPVSEKEAVSLVQPIMEAVSKLHGARICHLDIKPANIMLTHNEDGSVRPVLIDFGLSKHYDEHGHATSTINTFGYSKGFAPAEQYAGITTFSPGADVYSLGATLYFCLTGEVPPSAIDLSNGELAGMLPAGVSENLRAAIDLMTRNKRTRPTDLQQFLPLEAPPILANRKEAKNEEVPEVAIAEPVWAKTEVVEQPKPAKPAKQKQPHNPYENQPKPAISGNLKYIIIGVVAVVVIAGLIWALIPKNKAGAAAESETAVWVQEQEVNEAQPAEEKVTVSQPAKEAPAAEAAPAVNQPASGNRQQTSTTPATTPNKTNNTVKAQQIGSNKGSNQPVTPKPTPQPKPQPKAPAKNNSQSMSEF